MLNGDFFADVNRHIASPTCLLCNRSLMWHEYNQECSCRACKVEYRFTLLVDPGQPPLAVSIALIAGYINFSQWSWFLSKSTLPLPILRCPECKKDIFFGVTDNLGARCWGCGCTVLWYPVVTEVSGALEFGVKLDSAAHPFDGLPLPLESRSDYWRNLVNYAAKYVVSEPVPTTAPTAAAPEPPHIVDPPIDLSHIASPGVDRSAAVVDRVTSVSDFFKAFVGVDSTGFISRPALYQMYQVVCDAPVSQKRLYQLLRETYPMLTEEKRRIDGETVRVFVGIQLLGEGINRIENV